LRADVNGDRRPDRVWIAARKTGPIQCRYAVVAADPGHWLSSGIVVPRDPTSAPKLVVLASIDRRAGAEIVIERDHGASTAFALVLTKHDGPLTAIRADTSDGLFSYAGSLGNFSDVDCGRRAGTIVTAGAGTLDGTTYGAERSVYRINGTRLRRVSRTVLHRVSRDEALSLFPSRREPRPFGSCALTRYAPP
jgi:hypothetical protein